VSTLWVDKYLSRTHLHIGTNIRYAVFHIFFNIYVYSWVFANIYKEKIEIFYNIF